LALVVRELLTERLMLPMDQIQFFQQLLQQVAEEVELNRLRVPDRAGVREAEPILALLLEQELRIKVMREELESAEELLVKQEVAVAVQMLSALMAQEQLVEMVVME